MTDLNLIDTDTLAAACRTAAVSSAHADLLNAAAARLLAQASWIDGAKVDLDGYDEARAESQRATAWHMEALDDLAACVAERDEARAEVERLRLDADKRLSWAIFAVRDYDAYAQPFVLMRDTDVSGVSGTGVVADGVAFPDGTVALRWRGGNPTSVVFHDNGVESVEAIHGHGGATRLVWLAEDLETTAEVAATYDERDDWRRRYEALRADYNHLNERLDFAVETGSKMIKRYGALRDGVTDVAAWLATRCDCTDYGIGSEPCEHQEAANSLRAVVARVEES